MATTIRKSSPRREATWKGQRGWHEEHRLDASSTGHRITVHGWLEDGPQGREGEVRISRITGDFWRDRQHAVCHEVIHLLHPDAGEIEGAVSRLVEAADTGIPAVGSRWRLRKSVERYPHFVAPAGAVGIVSDTYEAHVSLRLEGTPLKGAEEWDNEVVWADDDGSRFRGDCEPSS